MKTSSLFRVGRKRLGLSRSHVAAQLGVSLDHLIEIEQGLRVPAAEEWMAFCGLVELSPDVLLEGFVETLSPVELSGIPEKCGYEVASRYLIHRGSKIRTLLPWVSFLRRNVGRSGFTDLCVRLGIDEDIFMDLDFQVNVNLFLDLSMAASSKGLLTPAGLSDFRQSLIHPESHGTVRRLWESAQGSGERLKRILESSRHYECNFEYRLDAGGLSSKVLFLEVNPEEHLTEFPDLLHSECTDFLCRYRSLYFSSLCEPAAGARPQVTERDCYFRGARQCVFEFRVPEPGRGLRLVS